MKKRNVRLLSLNKNSVSNLTKINGGIVELKPSIKGICPIGSGVFTCDPEACHVSITCPTHVLDCQTLFC